MMRRFTAAEEKLFHELWAGALFDLLHAVDTQRPEWEDDEQAALVAMVIEGLARRYGVIEDDEERPTFSP
jgi:hypothetical protein